MNNKINSEDLKFILDSLIFLNIKELKYICDKYDISYDIYIDNGNGLKKINEFDNKETIIENISYFFKTNKIPKKTIYTKKIINFDKLEKVKKDDKIYILFKSTSFDRQAII